MNILVLIYLLVNSLTYVSGFEMRQMQEFVFQISSLLLIMSSLIFQPKKYKLSLFENKFNICLMAMFTWFVCVFLKDKMGYSILINTFLGLGVYLTVIRNLEYKDLIFIIKNMLWIVAFGIAYIALQFLGYDLRGQGYRNVPNGVPRCSIWGLEAHYGLYLAMTLPLLLGISFINRDLGQRWKMVLNISIILVFIGLLFFSLIPSHSTGAYLGLLAAVLIYLWHRVRLVFWVAIVPVLVGAGLFLTIVDNPMGMQTTRFDMWGKVIQDSHLRPFGYGLDSFRNDEREGATKYFKHSFNNTTVRARKVKDGWWVDAKVPPEVLEKIKVGRNPLDYWDNPHNEPIQMFYETGFPGLFLLGFILFFIYKIFKFSMKRPLTVALYCSIVSIFIGSLAQFPIHVSRIGHAIPIITGMFIVSARDEN